MADAGRGAPAESDIRERGRQDKAGLRARVFAIAEAGGLAAVLQKAATRAAVAPVPEGERNPASSSVRSGKRRRERVGPRMEFSGVSDDDNRQQSEGSEMALPGVNDDNEQAKSIDEGALKSARGADALAVVAALKQRAAKSTRAETRRPRRRACEARGLESRSLTASLRLTARNGTAVLAAWPGRSANPSPRRAGRPPMGGRSCFRRIEILSRR